MECVKKTSHPNGIWLRKLFYSFGYDPEKDSVLKIDLKNLITRNPTSVDPLMTFTMKTYDKFDGVYSVIDSMEILIPEFNQVGSLSNLSVTFDHSVSNFFPSVATISFMADHKTLNGDASVKISFSDDFRFAPSQIAVIASQRFTTSSPTFTMVESHTIVIDNLSTLVSGETVSFSISSI
jgi:hypothetical protein